VTLGGRTLVPYDVLVHDPAYSQAMAEAGVEQPQNELVADLVYENVVWKQYIADAARDHEVPLWNGHLFGGLPFLASGQHSALYPSTLLFLLLSPARAFGWNALLAMWLAGLALYLYARRLGLGRFAALLSGLTWSVGLPLVANTVFPMIQGVMVWTPVILAGIEAAAAAQLAHGDLGVRHAFWLIVIAIATALASLSGHVEMLYYSAILCTAYALFRAATLSRRTDRSTGLRFALWVGAAALAGALIAGVQLVPLAELAHTSWRSGSEPYETIVGYAFGLRQLATFIVPDFYGNPSQHTVRSLADGALISLQGTSMWGTDWGTKNYVEAATYLGILPLLLAVIGLVSWRRRAIAWFWAAAGLVSLTFVFGMPTYKLLFLGLPGFDQLHTPFRWMFPVTLAMAVLAGLGADHLTRPLRDRFSFGLGLAVTALGLTFCGLLLAALLDPHRWTAVVEQLFDGIGALDAALAHFPDADALASYQFWNASQLALLTLLSGVAVLALAWTARRGVHKRIAQTLALLVVAADLILAGYGFNPAVEVALADVQPPVVEWLADATSVKWGRIVGYGSDKVLWPNTAMRSGISDLRGYESIIPLWTVETLNAIDGGGALEDPEQRHPMLTYNRFGNLGSTDSLAHPGLAALGGRYVVTTEDVDVAGLDLVFEDDVRVYENTKAMPRAWLVNQVRVIEDRDQLLLALSSFDPSTEVLLEESPSESIWAEMEPGRRVRRQSIVVREDIETRNSLQIEVVGAPSGGMLVVSEGWFPGWRAMVTPAGSDEAVEVPVYRADGMIRAVPVPPGLSTVELRYFPLSVKVGLYVTFLGAILLLLAAAYALWRRFVVVDRSDSARLIAINSAGPMAASMLNKAVDFVFAMLMLRILGSANAGSYYFAIAVIGFAEIFTNFGLNLLTAREVAKDPREAPRYLTNTSAIRVVLWVAVLPILAGYLWYERASGHPVGPETVIAIALLAVALLPGNLNAALTSVFQGREQMLKPAGVSIVTTLVKVSLGALVLLAGYGFVGLASVSIVANLVTFFALAFLAYREGIRPSFSISPRLMWAMAVVSLPLMLNHLLQTVFFKIDVLLLRRIDGPVVVGWYSTAYKWIDALLIIPPAVTMALFPILSRRAESDREGMQRAYVLALRWLLMLALPIAAATTFSATLLVGILGGSDYLPHGATALQIMIWFLPLSFVNGLTQYVLIALDRQRWITVSFAIAATFNVVANLILIPRYSYTGAAAVTIASEAVLLMPFLWGLRDLGSPPLLVILWRPAMATSLMALVLAGFDAIGMTVLIGVPIATAVYLFALVRLGAVTHEDRALVRRLLPSFREDPVAAQVAGSDASEGSP
jgi:O-antigen/teichoic acid export membrane protein